MDMRAPDMSAANTVRRVNVVMATLLGRPGPA
jgi:hypothetical protein